MATRVTQFYGPTETTVWSTAFEIEEVGTAAPPIGRPILNTRLYVLDEDREPVVTGAIGELYISGAGVAKGYLKRLELTGERFVADPFAGDGSRMYRTGDLVRWSDAGLLEFIGRADDQVKINGHRIELGEIESLLLQHPAVAEAAVAAHRNADSTTSLAAYVVAESGCLIEIDALRGFLAGRLPTYMMPSSFMMLDAMPLTPNGKLDRKSLAVPERAGRMAYAEPVTLIEKKLAALWQEILNVERVINGFSKHVLPRPADWPENSQVTGYWFFHQSQWRPPEALSEYLAAGPKPVYIGFGSMVSSHATSFTETVLAAVKKSGQRAVLASGWGGLAGDEGAQSEQIFFLRHAPHDWLFPRMSAAVHHGGAGTTAAAVRAGIPSVIVPFYGDQPFWARCLNRQGVAPPAVERKAMTADMLASALAAAQHPVMIQKAVALGSAVRAEDGIGEAVRCLREWDLLPSVTEDAALQPLARGIA